MAIFPSASITDVGPQSGAQFIKMTCGWLTASDSCRMKYSQGCGSAAVQFEYYKSNTVTPFGQNISKYNFQ